jgi:hypothetical protein
MVMISLLTCGSDRNWVALLLITNTLGSEANPQQISDGVRFVIL